MKWNWVIFLIAKSTHLYICGEGLRTVVKTELVASKVPRTTSGVGGDSSFYFNVSAIAQIKRNAH